MKTIKEWFLLLPEPYRTQALYNHESQQFNIGQQVSTLDEAVTSGFEWHATRNKGEGIKYWADCPTSLTPPTNALSAIHAIALKEGFPAEDITSIWMRETPGEWRYQLINSGEHHIINLSNESNGK